MLLLLGSCFSLCLMCGPAASSGIYAKYSNVVYTNRAWVSTNQPVSIGARSGSLSPAEDSPLTDNDVPRRGSGKAMPTVQQTWNGHPDSVRSAQTPQIAAAAPAAGGQAANAAPGRPQAAAPAGPVTTVHGIDDVARPIMPQGPERPPPQYNYREHFSSALFQPISRSNSQRNVIYSPASVHSMLGMLYGVSSGQTSLELQRAGQFGNDRLEVANDFQRLNQLQRELVNAQLIVANKLYYNRQLAELNPDYRRYAVEFFGSDIEPVNMKRAANTAARINAWASDATRGVIRELVTPGAIDEQTEALLVNAIYFKARWATEFSAQDTMLEKFRLGNNAVVTVPMMFNDDVFAYAELPDLDAKALELPYAGTDATMLLILPNQANGLAQLERQLAGHDLNAIAARLRRDTVTVRLPKFRVEFEQDLTGTLQQMGVRRMFTKESEVDAMLMQPVRVSKILQKAYIDVNEAGSEAAAATYAKFVPLSLPVKAQEFTADHPFFFAIRTPDTVLFIGHVVQPSQQAGTQ